MIPSQEHSVPLLTIGLMFLLESGTSVHLVMDMTLYRHTLADPTNVRDSTEPPALSRVEAMRIVIPCIATSESDSIR